MVKWKVILATNQIRARKKRRQTGVTATSIRLGCVGKLKMANKSGKKNEIQETNIELVESDCDVTKFFNALGLCQRFCVNSKPPKNANF